MKKLVVFLVLSLTIMVSGFSQHIRKVSVDMLQKSQSDLDPEAPAEYLENSLKQYIEFEATSGSFYLYKEFFVRIKVYDKDRFDGGTISFLINDQPGIRDMLINFKLVTYNLEGNKIKKIKLAKKDLHIEKVAQYVNRYKIAVPGIKDGTVFEYSYIIKTERLLTKKWYFQHDLPVLYSSFLFKYPDYFKYDFKTENIQDQHPKMDYRTETIPVGNSTIEIPYVYCTMEMKDIKPLDQEPYMPPASHLAKALNYSLKSIEFKNNYTFIATSWSTVAKYFNDALNLLDNVITKSQLKKYVNEAAGQEQDAMKRLENIYYYVQKHTQWNGLYTAFPADNFVNAFKIKSTSATINFLLVQLLRQSGFSAFPVLITTRDYGKLYPDFPSANDLNNMIAGVIINGKTVLMDAASSLTPFGYLPVNDLNEYYLPIMPNTTGLQKLQTLYNGGSVKTYISGKIDNNILAGTLTKKYSGYQAINVRANLLQTTDRENYFKPENFEISDFSINNLDDIKKDLDVKFKFSLNLSTVDSSIFIEPLLGLGFQNPFKASERKYPVDFINPASYEYVINIQIPEGYKATNIPKPAKINMPDKAASFFFYIQQNVNILQIVVRLNFTKTYYPPEEYENLRKFFTAVDNYQHQIIELTKQ